MNAIYPSIAEGLHQPFINIINTARARLFCYASLMTGKTAISGCNSFGPDAGRGTNVLNNDTIVSSMNDQFIQNIIRPHYQDPTFFLDIASEQPL